MSSTEIKANSFSELIKGDTPVLVDFYADWCAPCKMMPPILKEVKKRFGDSLIIIKIDTERNPEAAIRYNIRGIPNMVLFYKGQLLWQQAGVMQAPQIESIIKQKLEQYADL